MRQVCAIGMSSIVHPHSRSRTPRVPREGSRSAALQCASASQMSAQPVKVCCVSKRDVCRCRCPQSAPKWLRDALFAAAVTASVTAIGSHDGFCRRFACGQCGCLMLSRACVEHAMACARAAAEFVSFSRVTWPDFPAVVRQGRAEYRRAAAAAREDHPLDAVYLPRLLLHMRRRIRL